MSVANKLRQIALLSIALSAAPAVPAQQANTVPSNATLAAAAASAHPMASYNQWLATNMTPWLSMFNPYYYAGWSNVAINPWINQATQPAMVDAMMRSMDPRLMFGAGGAMPAGGIPGWPTQAKTTWRPNTVTEGVSLDAKRNFYQSMMKMNPLSMRDMIGIMANKMAVAEDVSFDDAVEAMKLRANEVNFKLVGESPLWKDVVAMTGDEETPRVEIFLFCDAVVARKILDYVPEFAVFLPCRIALLEDADKKLWVMTLDWDVNWLDYSQNPNSKLADDLIADATRIRDALHYIMEGAATGDF
jgi:uncharacterized protein (DUF302 family)